MASSYDTNSDPCSRFGLTLRPPTRTESRAMLFESRHITVTADHGTATLAFGFGGRPVNALDLDPPARTRCRSHRGGGMPGGAAALSFALALPDGFCAGPSAGRALASLTHPADRAAFAWYGQQVLRTSGPARSGLRGLYRRSVPRRGLRAGTRLRPSVCRRAAEHASRLPGPFRVFRRHGSTASPCRPGAGIELGGVRPDALGARVRTHGLVDVACCERRAKIELRTFLDRLEARPIKRRRVTTSTDSRPNGGRSPNRSQPGHGCPAAASKPSTRLPPFPDVMGLLGNDPVVERLAAESVLRGGSVVVCGNRSGVFAGIATAHERGFVTPLEAEQAWLRVSRVRHVRRLRPRWAGVRRLRPESVPARGRDSSPDGRVRRVPRRERTARAPTGPAMPFPFPRRLLRIGFCDADRVALFPTPHRPGRARHGRGVGQAIRGFIGGVPGRVAVAAAGGVTATIAHEQILETAASARARRAGQRRLRPLYPEAATASDAREPTAIVDRHDPFRAVYRRAGESGHARAVRALPDRPRLRRMRHQGLESLIKSTGFYKNKAKNIRSCCAAILERFGGEVPKTLEDLVSLPGVGRKTANVVLGDAFGTPGITVDTHVGRLSRRLGFTRHNDPVKVEFALMELIPQPEWTAFSHRLILHGRSVCFARKPRCELCPLASLCPKIGVKRKQKTVSPRRTRRGAKEEGA